MNPLDKISGTIVTGLVISVVIAVGTNLAGASAANSLIIWLHVAAGVTWIGLLYYFNFVQAPSIGEANADAEGPGPAAITKYVAPRALLWFRWAALVTWLSGALFLFLNGTLGDAFELGLRTGNPYATTIGIGAWLGTIMLFNVWILIWPNQKKVLGIVEATAEEKARGARIAFLASRTNTMLSIPMLMSMVGAGHGFFM
tara:strand:- start:1270 stop:1869 length:600 start_codon:yes stop_codon:yes gene_type:complete